jgi:hypothetical protein
MFVLEVDRDDDRPVQTGVIRNLCCRIYNRNIKAPMDDWRNHQSIGGGLSIDPHSLLVAEGILLPRILGSGISH